MRYWDKKWMEVVLFIMFILFPSTAFRVGTLRYHRFSSSSNSGSTSIICPYSCQRGKRKPLITLEMKPWWEDDLPNILGINPLEATVIFGILYYLYGPNVLYEYARTAGNAFGKYAPVVKDAAFGVYNEFKDFLEENRELELLAQQGVDISNIPRKTTNIIERFKEAYDGFGDGANKSEESSEVQEAYSQSGSLTEVAGEKVDVSEEARSARDVQKTTADGRRRSKKDILKERNINIDGVKEAAMKRESQDDLRLKETANAVRERMNSLGTHAKYKQLGVGEDPTLFPTPFADANEGEYTPLVEDWMLKVSGFVSIGVGVLLLFPPYCLSIPFQ